MCSLYTSSILRVQRPQCLWIHRWAFEVGNELFSNEPNMFNVHVKLKIKYAALIRVLNGVHLRIGIYHLANFIYPLQHILVMQLPHNFVESAEKHRISQIFLP